MLLVEENLHHPNSLKSQAEEGSEVVLDFLYQQ